MKKTFFALVVFLLTLAASHTVHAIDNNSQYVLGIHVDPILSWFSSDNNRFSGSAANVGLNAGIEVEYKFARRY